ncbi:hypothetical protein B9G55_08155 [Saccharibacillus sp. O16]|nr:hypothetical protein B9G55_08155 [Saccharibacillus sp. O16]
MNLEPQTTLTGSIIALVPLEESHRLELCRVLYDPRIWEHTWLRFASIEELEQDFNRALAGQADGTRLPFAIVHRQSGAVIGTTSFGDIDVHNHGIEIGWTSLSPDYWRTGVNTECKYLLLRYGFEKLNALRVQFSVSSYNLRSQRAVERLGAIKEGVLRKHRIEPGGRVHDNVFYSILAEEWSGVKQRLEEKMNRIYEPSVSE